MTSETDEDVVRVSPVTFRLSPQEGIQPIVTLIPSSDGVSPSLCGLTVDTETMDADIDAETPDDSWVMVELAEIDDGN